MRQKNYRVLTPEDFPKIVKMLEEGHTAPQIALEMQVSATTIVKKLHVFGYKHHPQKGWILADAPKKETKPKKTLSETELKTAVKHGFITQKAYAKELAAMGYSPANVDLKLKLLRKEIQEKVVYSKPEETDDRSGLPNFEDDAKLLTEK